MKQEIEALRAELHSIVDSKIDKLIKPEFEVGKWYKNSCHIFYPTDLTDLDNIKGYGMYNGNWKEYSDFSMLGNDRVVLATPTEVQQAFEKEAVKRYGELKVGDKVKGHWGNEIKTMNDKRDYYLSMDSQHIYFGINNVCLMCDGKWAEIVKEMSLESLAEKLESLTEFEKAVYIKKNKTQIIETLSKL